MGKLKVKQWHPLQISKKRVSLGSARPETQNPLKNKE
jgi:hypothetical protein